MGFNWLAKTASQGADAALKRWGVLALGRYWVGWFTRAWSEVSKHRRLPCLEWRLDKLERAQSRAALGWFGCLDSYILA